MQHRSAHSIRAPRKPHHLKCPPPPSIHWLAMLISAPLHACLRQTQQPTQSRRCAASSVPRSRARQERATLVLTMSVCTPDPCPTASLTPSSSQREAASERESSSAAPAPALPAPARARNASSGAVCIEDCRWASRPARCGSVIRSLQNNPQKPTTESGIPVSHSPEPAQL